MEISLLLFFVVLIGIRLSHLFVVVDGVFDHCASPRVQDFASNLGLLMSLGPILFLLMLAIGFENLINSMAHGLATYSLLIPIFLLLFLGYLLREIRLSHYIEPGVQPSHSSWRFRMLAQTLLSLTVILLLLISILFSYGSYDLQTILIEQSGVSRFMVGTQQMFIPYLPNWGFIYQPLGLVLTFIFVLKEQQNFQFFLRKVNSHRTLQPYGKYFRLFYGGFYWVLFALLIVIAYFGGPIFRWNKSVTGFSFTWIGLLALVFKVIVISALFIKAKQLVTVRVYRRVLNLNIFQIYGIGCAAIVVTAMGNLFFNAIGMDL